MMTNNETTMTARQSSIPMASGNDTHRWLCWGSLAAMLLLVLPASVLADVKLPALVSDHMVLQRDMPLPIWGWADPGEKVTVSLAGQTQSATAGENGRWQVTFSPLKVGEPLTMDVDGKNHLQVKDILVGEVWLCSGQSNMEWIVANSRDADLEMPAADFPQIRLITCTNLGSQTPVEDFDGHWDVCSPQTVGQFSAVGYFFGRELYEQLGVPIGLIHNAWGGSACEAWIPRERMEGNPLFQPQIDHWDQVVAEFDEEQARADFARRVAEWEDRAKAAREADKPEPPNRPWWVHPVTGQFRPANLYHARIEPLIPYAIRGVIWYQGETNAGRSYQYREMFPLLIQSWRDAWGQGDFPFYWVQLADFMAEPDEPGESGWAELREAQTMTLDRLPNTGQAVIIDLGEADNIHPRNKVDVARRLARWALARDYGLDIPYRSPRYESMERDGQKIVVKFKDVGGGLQALDTLRIEGFAIAGEDRHWVWADARIVAPDRVAVYSDEVPQPVAVRYAWASNPVCNLYSAARLPVTPFRTDDWPGETIDAR